MRTSVDGERCTGHGRCYSVAPSVYDADEAGHSLVLLADVPAQLREQAQLAAQECPEQAIVIVEDRAADES